MPKTDSISWRDLTGNKFIIALDSAMLSEAGYVKQQSIRKIGDVVGTIFNVNYDREYVLEVLSRKICKKFFSLGKEKTLQIVSDAWDYTYPNQVKQQREVALVADE